MRADAAVSHGPCVKHRCFSCHRIFDSVIIRQSKGEAYNNAFVGRKKITYQEPAMGEDYCPNCGATADAISNIPIIETTNSYCKLVRSV